MDETSEVPEQGQRSYSGLLVGVLAVAVLCALAGLVWSYTLAGRLTKAEAQVESAQQNNQKLQTALNQTNARLQVTTETLGQSLGMTQKQLEAKAEELLSRQEADAQRLEQQQRQIKSVSNDVSGVKSDVGGVKTDLTATKTKLQGDEDQMQKMQGDMGLQSGLIATNGKELDVLKHMGDRNYYEFTLGKNQKKAVATVALELKKADPKHSKFTLVVYADDKEIQKKDRNLDEPIQFYTGKDHMLYELVVNDIDKNQVKGYIATPKNAPVPVTPSSGN